MDIAYYNHDDWRENGDGQLAAQRRGLKFPKPLLSEAVDSLNIFQSGNAFMFGAGWIITSGR